jgi:uncharacterized protein (DUF1330 family)
MAKAYWICSYQTMPSQEILERYAAGAGPAIRAGGGRFLARSVASKSFESGKTLRTVVIEFDSVDQAVATYESAAYKTAAAEIKNACQRDVRIVEAVG